MYEYDNEDEWNEAEGWKTINEGRLLLTRSGGWMKFSMDNKYLYEDSAGYPPDRFGG